jgi:DNA-binding response OmpR family regulator
VLLVEKDEGLRKMISGILTIDGYTVCDAPTAEEAVTRAFTPQLIIADTTSRYGLDCLRRLQKTRQKMRIIGTAAERPALAGPIEAHSAHLPKPFALSALLTQVRRLLDEKSR